MPTRSDAFAEARRLVVHEGYSYSEAADVTGIPLSTLQKRAAGEDWQSARDVQMSYAAQVRSLKSSLLARAIAAMQGEGDKPPDPQAAAQLTFAWKQAESTWPEHRYTTQKEDPKVRLAIALEVLEELVDHFATVDRTLVTRMEPHLGGFAKALEKRLVA
jgi:hypothetical protein